MVLAIVKSSANVMAKGDMSGALHTATGQLQYNYLRILMSEKGTVISCLVFAVWLPKPQMARSWAKHARSHAYSLLSAFLLLQ